MFSAATVTTTTFVAPAVAASTLSSSSSSIDVQSGSYDVEGVSAITKSALGTSVRSSVVKSAKLVDAVDLKWERFSDSLRDKKKCDPRTNRRLFDNGIRSDGTPRGSPVLGALCDPVPLRDLDETLVQRVLGEAFDNAAYEILGSTSTDRPALKGIVDQTRDRLEPAFARALDAKSDSNSNSNAKTKETTPKSTASAEDDATPVIDEAKKRQRYNLEVYSRVRAYGEALATASASSTSTTVTPTTTATTTTKPQSKASYIRQTGRKLDLLWGRNLLDQLAGPSNADYEFESPFPKPDANIPFPYDVNKLTNALGAIEKALQVLQDGGLIGHWEISIPEDDYGEVVTIAVDDDVCLGAQILAREENAATPMMGSPVVAMVRSALEDRAKIPYAALDVFFIDPTTTKNELYNPTQLLVSLRNLGEEP